MIRPFCVIVRALKFLQKSMMLTPCWPSAGPTGGAGVASPAGICSFTYPVIFFAIVLASLAGKRKTGKGKRRPDSFLSAYPVAIAPSFPVFRFPFTDSSDLLDLQKLELHGRRTPEDCDHHF